MKKISPFKQNEEESAELYISQILEQIVSELKNHFL